MKPQPHRNATLIVAYATLAGILLLCLISVLMLWWSGPMEPKLFLQSIGINLLSSVAWAAVFAVVTTRVVNRVQDDILRDKLDAQATDLATRQDLNHDQLVTSVQQEIARMMSALSTWNTTYLPTRTYPPSSGFNEDYNRDLMGLLADTATYTFHGPSARFVASRLDVLRKLPDHVYITMTDPRHEQSIGARAADRKATIPYQSKDVAEIAAQFRDELFASIVALYDLRTRCRIEIALTRSESIYRYELTDDSLFFSWYHSPGSGGSRMPHAMRFSNESMLYRILQLESRRRMDAAEPTKIVFKSDTSAASLLSIMADLTSDPKIDATSIGRYRALHAQVTSDFNSYLRGRRGYGAG